MPGPLSPCLCSCCSSSWLDRQAEAANCCSKVRVLVLIRPRQTLALSLRQIFVLSLYRRSKRPRPWYNQIVQLSQPLSQLISTQCSWTQNEDSSVIEVMDFHPAKSGGGTSWGATLGAGGRGVMRAAAGGKLFVVNFSESWMNHFDHRLCLQKPDLSSFENICFVFELLTHFLKIPEDFNRKSGQITLSAM